MDRELNLEGLLRNEEYDKPTTCPKCGKKLIYKGVGEYKCEACGELTYDAYGLVRNYLEEHPGANASNVMNATGVSKKVIATLVRQGRIDVNSGVSNHSGGLDE